MRTTKLLVVIFFTLGIFSCNNSTTVEKSTEKVEQEQDIPEKESSKFVIRDNTFMGVKPLDLIAEHASKLQSGKIRVGDVVKEVLVIEVKGSEIGYVEPFKKDETLIGNMTFSSSEVKTDRGLGVGSSFREILEIHPDLKLKVTKDGKQLYARAGKIAFLLDYHPEGSEVHISSVPENSKVREVKLLAGKKKRGA